MHRDRKQIRECQGIGSKRNKRIIVYGYRVSFKGDKNVLELDRSDVHDMMDVLNVPELYTLKGQCYINFTSI